jgi:hypothetical protein
MLLLSVNGTYTYSALYMGDSSHVSYLCRFLHSIFFCACAHLRVSQSMKQTRCRSDSAYILMSSPAENFWRDPFAWQSLHCESIGLVMFTVSVINTVLELVLALLPLPVIFDLNLSRRQQLSVLSILCLGIMVTILGCVRTWFVWKSLIGSWDISWWGGPHWIVSEVENNVALVSQLVILSPNRSLFCRFAHVCRHFVQL